MESNVVNNESVQVRAEVEKTENVEFSRTAEKKQQIVDTQPSTITSVEVRGNDGFKSEERTGVVFDEQTQEVELIRPSTSNLRKGVDEMSWSYDKILALPVKLTTFDFDTTQNPGDLLYNIPTFSLYKNVSRWRNIIDQYQYVSFKVRFRIEMNSSKFTLGKLMAYIAPRSNFTPVGPKLFRAQIVQLPHVSLYPSDNTHAELETEWYSSMEYMPTNFLSGAVGSNGFDFSDFQIKVFNQFNTVAGSGTICKVSVYASLHDVQLYIPRLTPVEQAVAQGLIDFSSHTTIIKDIESSNLPVNMTGDAYDVSAGFTGFDQPANTQSPELVVRNTKSNDWSARGFPPTKRASLYQASQTVASRYNFERTSDEMTILSIAQKPGFIGDYVASSVDVPGKVLFTQKIVPYLEENPEQSTVPYTPLQWVSSFFRYWRGTIRYCVEFVNTKYHTGKFFLGVAYGPNYIPSSVDPSSLTSLYGKVIELNEGQNCFEIDIPFQYPLSWSRVADTRNYWGEELRDRSTPYPFLSPDGSIGYVFLSVINSLVSPPTVPSQIAFNVYHSAGDDYELHTPANTVGIGQVDTIGIGRSANDSGGTPLTEECRTIRDLIKRTTPYGMVPLRFDPNMEDDTTDLVSPTAIATLQLKQAFLFSKFKMLDPYMASVGDIRVKLVASPYRELGYATDPNIYVFYVPPAASRRTPVNQWMWIADSINSFFADNNFELYDDYMKFGFNDTRTHGQSVVTSFRPATRPVLGYNHPYYFDTDSSQIAHTVHMDSGIQCIEVLTPATPSVEIEIPYYSNRRYVYHHNNESEGSDNAWDDCWGTLIFAQRVLERQTIDPTSVSANNRQVSKYTTGYVSVFINGGDTYRSAIWRATQPKKVQLKGLMKTKGDDIGNTTVLRDTDFTPP